ncbi:dTDP-4-dehydrorhamnose reductase [Anaerocolumna chitinilytica]|uniref:dTDP-4-dehydrorhamnose reductase n=1 Tax=Anaerocolumna chitinilytica TaxID=1727145 RepID=A0A7I8DX92_9FIRM|nr:dTDP-4-dehydrorhamnose reductase [Anaerocolumna chitinilytica]BCK00897.1 NAD(P)-dependent oxidoreductase [Anaerocolumna chitinilytica]
MERRILITGANGQLGIAINDLLKNREDITLINTCVLESSAYCPIKLDITNPMGVMNLIQELNPQIIINCAAHTQVDLCESDQDRAYAINALGPKHLAEAAQAVEARLIHISTDYVFNGEKTEAYKEEDETDPKSVYGSTKLAGEEFVKNICDNYQIVRTAWLYGEGKNFVRTMLRLAEEGKDIKVVADQYGCPTSALELARTLGFLIDTDEVGTFHAVCEGVTTWYEFAAEIFKQTGKEVNLSPISTEEYRVAAKRPPYSVLSTKKLNDMGYHMKNWKDALKEYLDTQAQ